MSNVSSKSNKSDHTSQSRLRNFLFYSQRSGAFALVEFLLMGIVGLLGAYFSHHTSAPMRSLLTAAYVIQISCLVLLPIHIVVTIKRRRWDPWFSLLAVLLIYFVSQGIATSFLDIYPRLQGWTDSRTTAWLNHAVTAQSVYFVLTAILALGMVYGYLRLFRITFAALGLRRPHWRDLGYGLAAVPVYLIFYVLVVVIVSHFVPGLDVNQKQHIGFESVHGSAQLVLTFVSLVVVPPLMEEIIFRGLLYSSLKKALPIVAAVITTSFIFASAHLPEGGASGPLYIAALDTFVLSLVLIYLREKTGGLWASMTLHALKNGYAFLLLFVLHTS